MWYTSFSVSEFNIYEIYLEGEREREQNGEIFQKLLGTFKPVNRRKNLIDTHKPVKRSSKMLIQNNRPL